MSKQKLVLSFPAPVDVRAAAQSWFDVTTDNDVSMSTDRIVESAQKAAADAILLGHSQRLSLAQIAALPASVKIVATSSVGYDHLDVAAFAKRGIVTTNTPDVLTDATANMAMLLLLAVTRRLREHVAFTESGWGRTLAQGEMLGMDLAGKTLGILGMGRIGQAFARRAKAFDLDVLYCNRRRLPADEENGARYVPTLGELLPQCDIFSLHAPGTRDTEKIIGAREFALLPKGAILINVSRGTLVDEDALFKSLDEKHLAAAGLDVCWNEPNPDPRFKNYPQILLTPHVASATRETRVAMGLRALENIKSVLSGQTPRDRLSPAVVS